MNSYDNIWGEFSALSARILWFNPFVRDILKEIYDSSLPSRTFIKSQPFQSNSQGWLSRCVLEGVPVIQTCPTSNDNILERTMYPSVCEVSAMLLQISQVTSLMRRRYFYSYVANLQIPVLRLVEKALQSQIGEKEGIIIVMDMTKSTPYIFKAEYPLHPSKELAELLHCMHRIGAVVKIEGFLMGSRDPGYWVTEGDKFIGFIPFNEVPDGKRLFIFFVQLQKELLEVKKSFGISFKIGAHWGNLLISGDVIRSNSEIIKATRVMEFSKREGVIIISETLKKKIVGELPAQDLDTKFNRPMVLLEGKPNKWIRPEEVSISITDDEEMRLYEIESKT